MKRFFAGCCVIICLAITSARAQGAFQPFGLDMENLDVSKCNHNIGCPLLDEAAVAGAQWVRLLAIWYFLEPQQDSYNWGELPWQVWYAGQKGINIYFTATWAPQWANGAISTCPPYAGATQTGPGTSGGGACQNGYQDVGRTVTNSNYTYNFFYNLALQFNGSDTSGCPSGNVSTCHPLVQYFGVWNEPDGLNNYNDVYFDGGNLGNYLNDFVTQYLSPAYNAVKAANPSASVGAADLGTGSGVTCGGFGNCGGWQGSWMQPLSQFFSGSYDFITVHGYHAHHGDDTSMIDTVLSNYAHGKFVWLTETAYGSSSDVTGLYVDEFNRQGSWTKAFYSGGGYHACSSSDAAICSPDGVNLQLSAWGSAFQQAYFPH